MFRLVLKSFCNAVVRSNASLVKNVQSCRFLSCSISRSYLTGNVLFKNGPKLACLSSCNRLRQLHSSGDADLAEYLKDEIKLEKEHDKSISKKVRGFEVSKSEGPNVVLTKKQDNETITIKFNVNNTVEDSLLSSTDQQQQEDDVAMVSRPAFVIEIDKGGEEKLAIHCVFPTHEDLSNETPSNEEAYEDLLEIQDVALLKKNQEWDDDVYSLSGNVMDGNLYDMLLKMLEERGVDADFLDDLVDWSTSYEHKNYVTLLEGIQSFVKSK
ncbi:hypothetical protein HELRODRAFT_188672 [Helobdella robusta]|uniref:Complement component 1 Q subcomponent-binding protein, mitochondrial n=1 Tax=Helobdella robusta TaxID=6412 RepID=T1FQ84_HELRO|nr:hypothetical protein HELRODRAFT_188672 [Helobdella robusta]ESO02357.1 hypothetical protein HELRODRAFT_188672 [Helobdella robusta]